jgi:hypothetical protein
MKTLPGRWSCVLLLPALLVGLSLLGAVESRAQQTTSKASVGVEIRVGPIAQIEFPQGTGFELYIPSRQEGLADQGPFSPARAPHVATAQIPFTVVGNAWAVVSALPADILQVLPDGPVGKAFPGDPEGPNQGVELPYRLRLEFPEGTPVQPLAGLENPRGRNPTDDGTASANVASGPVFGVIHVIPDIIWGEIASGRFVNHGLYRGEVQVTIAATEN